MTIISIMRRHILRTSRAHHVDAQIEEIEALLAEMRDLAWTDRKSIPKRIAQKRLKGLLHQTIHPRGKPP